MEELTNAQKSIWVTEQYYKGTSINSICGTATISEKVDFERLKKAITNVCEKHDNFRLQMKIEDGEAKQVLSEKNEIKIDTINVVDSKDMEKKIKKIVSIPFKLENSELFKFYIFKFKNGEGAFTFNFHHFIADAWTLALICNETIQIYSALKQNKEIETKPIYSYIDYIKSEKEYQESEKFQKDKLYWEEKFINIPEVATIPGSKRDIEQMSPKGKRKQFKIDASIIDKMKLYCKQNKISLYNFFMAIYAIYISEISNLDEFVIGTPILNRTNYKEKNSAGMFINMAPFKINLKGISNFKTFVKNIAIDSMNMLKHQKYSYQCLLENLRNKNKNIPNLYNILLSYQITNTQMSGEDIKYKTEWTFNGYCTEDMDIQIFDINDTGSLDIAYDYKKCIYNENDIEKLHKRILNIIEQVISKDDIEINDIEIITPEEKQILIGDFNKTELKYDDKENVINLFEKQVLKTPEKIAIICNEQKLTYKELNEKANYLAREMIRKGVKQNDIVGIMLNRSIEMITGIIATLKCGAAYLPIDPEYPIERITYMLENSETKTVLVNTKTEKNISKECNKINISKIEGLDSININLKINKESLVYLIYTSGSTGKPKGVQITNKNLSNFIVGMKEKVDFSPNKTMLSVTTICFDIFGLEIWCSLTSGQTLVVANELEQNMPRLLNKLCLKNKVNIMQTTPSRYSVIFEDKDNLEFMNNLTDIFVGGEAINQKILTNMKKYSNLKIYNVYGPTETTIWSTIKELTNEEEITIGRPIANTKCFILNKNRKMLPPNIPGELYIGGDGVSKGYLKREELNKEKFLDSSIKGIGKIYNTNDLAYFTENGEIIHLGRTDFQVKIRGYRVELGEIENVIEKNKAVNKVIVINKKMNNGHEVLIAYYTTKQQEDIGEVLRKEVMKELPAYMVPQYFKRIDKIPHTPNGKVDRKSLPDIYLQNINKEIVKPRNDIDKEIIKIVSKILGIKQISIEDKLLELGGDSLTAITLSTKIQSQYKVQINIKDIILNYTIKDISDYIKENKDKYFTRIVIPIAKNQEYYPLSLAQKRIYYETKIIGEKNKVYNMPGAIMIEELVDAKRIEQICKIIMQRHSILRSSFVMRNEDIVQKINNNIDFKVKTYYNVENEIDTILKEFSKPFNLEVGPLFRLEVHYINNQKTLLLFETHHIIMDGTALNNFITEFSKLYNNEKIEELPIQYKDYAVWENENQNYERYEKYWLDKFKNFKINRINLPYDYEVYDNRNHRGKKIVKKLDSKYFEEIEKYSKTLGASPYMLMITVFFILLYKYSNQSEINVIVPVENRNMNEVQNLIGMFVNNIIATGTINEDKTFREILSQVKKQTISDLENQEYPFDKLVKKLKLDYEVASNNLFNVMFAYQNNEKSTIKLENCECNIFQINNETAKFNLSFEINPKANSIHIEYNTDRFKETTIDRIFDNYIDIINCIMYEADVKIKDIDITIQQNSNKKLNENLEKNNVHSKYIINFELEKILTDILKETLSMDNIESTDNFFELGIDSIIAMKLQIAMASHNIKIEYGDIFKYPTIRTLAAHMQEKQDELVIKRVEERDFYPISSAQKRIYLTSSMDSNSKFYNITGGVLMNKIPDIQRLENTLNKVIEKHEILRTYFEVNNNGEIVQKIRKSLKINLSILDGKGKDIEEIFSSCQEVFNLNKCPLIAAKLVMIDKNKTLFIIDVHHIIFDGSSWEILLNEILDIYNGEEKNKLTISYKDYAIWENEQLKMGKMAESKSFWNEQFIDGIPILNMPTTYPRPAKRTYKGDTYVKKISPKLMAKIQKIAKKIEVTPYVVMLTAYYILLYKYTGQEDIIVGTPISKRTHKELEGLLGMFVNTLPLKWKICKQNTVEQMLVGIKNLCLQCFEHQEYPFDSLVNDLNIGKDASRNPLFDTMFVYQNNLFKSDRLSEVLGEYCIPKSKTSKFDISLEVMPLDKNTNISFEYWTDLYNNKFIKDFANHYCNILKEIVDNTEIKIQNITMLGKKEKEKILYKFNETKLEYDKKKTIIQYFEDQVSQNPERVALVFKGKNMTYKELNEKANSLAYELRQCGIKNNSIVGILKERSFEMVIAILATMKSGGGYIPIDTSYPDERIKYMLENSNVELLLTEEKQIKRFNDKQKKININLDNVELYSRHKENLINISEPNDLLYLIYTSGSTGTPKGVMIKQQNLSNFYSSVCKQIPYLYDKKTHNAISVTTVSFDVFVFETIISLARGITIYMTSEYEQKMIYEIEKIISKNQIEIIHTTPSVMQVYLRSLQRKEDFNSLKYIMLAGEQLPMTLVKEIKSIIPKVKIYNGYGPSETFYCTIQNVTNSNIISIGKPLANTQIYILDKDNNICPIGVPGELYVSGDGVGIGYCNNESITKERFLKDIFNPNKRMYKTGDCAVYLPNGEIKCIGRLDNQIKIRGLRIELDEIEKCILKYPNIDKCIISAKKDNNSRQFIVAYITIKDRISINKLRLYLKELLPQYMIPAYFVILDKIPYLNNGKIDKKALPEPKYEKDIDEKTEYVAPSTEIEVKLVNIFQNLLSISPIGIYDNFFKLGGDSLLAMSLQVELLKQNYNVTYSDIFMYPTVKELQEIISNRIIKDKNDIKNGERFEKFKPILNNVCKLPEKIIKKDLGNILITGTTGYLGAHILKEYLEKEKGKAYCIIRSEYGINVKDKLKKKLNFYFGNRYDQFIDNRIIIVNSDITEENIGLKQEEITAVFKDISTVINCAAKVSHYGNYNDFKVINVNALENLIKLSIKYNKRFYQISTEGIVGDSYIKEKNNTDEKQIIFKENDFFINQSLENVYLRSKFEAEEMMLQYVLKGLNGYIFRVGNLLNRYSDGVFQPNIDENAYINRIMSYFNIGYIPKKINNDYMEITPVDKCAEAIMKIMQYPTNNNRIFHIYNHNYVLIEDFIHKLQQYGKINIVDEDEFTKILNKLYLDKNSSKILSGILQDIGANGKIALKVRNNINSDFTVSYLKKIGFEWPVIDDKYLEQFLKYFEKKRLFEKMRGERINGYDRTFYKLYTNS